MLLSVRFKRAGASTISQTLSFGSSSPLAASTTTTILWAWYKQVESKTWWVHWKTERCHMSTTTSRHFCHHYTPIYLSIYLSIDLSIYIYHCSALTSASTLTTQGAVKLIHKQTCSSTAFYELHLHLFFKLIYARQQNNRKKSEIKKWQPRNNFPPLPPICSLFPPPFARFNCPTPSSPN